MVIKISNVMAEIQITKIIVLFLARPSLKNVATSLTNEEKEKEYKKKLDKIKPTNFHRVPKLIIDYVRN
jgi:hypothetical protein